LQPLAASPAALFESAIALQLIDALDGRLRMIQSENRSTLLRFML
jgi:hypothetical protein